MMSNDAIAARYGSRVGERVGSLVFLAIADDRGERSRLLGVFRCDCGNEATRPLGRTLSGGSLDHCGCRTDHGAHRTHGKRGAPAYVSWQAMKRRCLDPNDKDFPRYGAKGVTVCPQWTLSFEAFYLDMGDRPAGTTLDRVDGARGYERDNCRWATPGEQARNRRDLVVVSTPSGIMPLVDYAVALGISKGAAHQRFKRGQLEGVSRV